MNPRFIFLIFNSFYFILFFKKYCLTCTKIDCLFLPTEKVIKVMFEVFGVNSARNKNLTSPAAAVAYLEPKIMLIQQMLADFLIFVNVAENRYCDVTTFAIMTLLPFPSPPLPSYAPPLLCPFPPMPLPSPPLICPSPPLPSYAPFLPSHPMPLPSLSMPLHLLSRFQPFCTLTFLGISSRPCRMTGSLASCNYTR